MSNEMTVYDVNQDIVVARPPEVVLSEAKKAATALHGIVSNKPKKVMMNGEQYLEFEDWQTVGRFYGVTAKVMSTEFMDLGGVQGFLARAVALRADGAEISAAEAMCMNDEQNWKSKPLFQLRSMAQTRACAKALRNVLAWVVVLAGYKPTPAEEMDGINGDKRGQVQEPKKKPAENKPEAPSEGMQEVTTAIKNVACKEGETNGKPWKLYTLTGESGAYKTFSDTYADLGSTAMQTGAKAKIQFVTEKNGNRVMGMELEGPAA